MTSSLRDRASLAATLGALLVSVAAAFVVADPSPKLLLPLALVVVIALSLVVPAATFLAASLLVFGALQPSLGHPIQVGGFAVYSSDLLLLVAALRAALPRTREASPPGFLPVTKLVFAFAAAAILWGLWHGHAQGEPIASAARTAFAGFYYPILFVCFSRILREASFALQRFLLESALIVTGFIAFTFTMRTLGRPFEHADQLGLVVLANGAVLHRDFGYATSFCLFGLLSVFAASWIRGRATSSRFPQLLLVLGVAATLSTLIRGLVFGLILGLGLALLVSMKASQRSRVGAIVQVVALLAASVSLLALASAGLRQGVAERFLPSVMRQSLAAQANADERLQAVRVGLKVADAKAMGSGFVSPTAVAVEGVDPTYLHDSSPAWLLVFLGWPGAILGAVALLAVLGESWRLPTDEPWLHTAFVGSIAMLAAYSLSSAGLVGQPWVVGPTALILALRFGRPSSRQTKFLKLDVVV